MNIRWNGARGRLAGCPGHLCVTAVLASVLVIGAVTARAQHEPQVSDTPDDWGTSLTVTWQTPPYEVTGYEIWRRETDRGAEAETFIPPDTIAVSDFLLERAWQRVAEPGPEDTVFADSELSHEKQYQYVLVALTADRGVAFGPFPPKVPTRQWVKHETLNILVAVAAFTAIVVLLVERARRGASLFIRRIAGLEAVEEAVGRATEMGRPILYVPGLDPMDEVATVAAIDILGQVAKKAGEYETRLVVPNRDPIVMAVAQQVVRESYSAVGKPHLYRDENVFYVTYSQFGFAAAVAGLMMRDRPATNFFIGHFYAESLVLAETGNATGAIQIAGTDSDAQLPFFISACDYTLIGEELYAGSVYLSRHPLLLGALKAQDYAKAFIIAAMAGGVLLYILNPGIAETFGSLFR